MKRDVLRESEFVIIWFEEVREIPWVSKATLDFFSPPALGRETELTFGSKQVGGYMYLELLLRGEGGSGV